MAPWAYLFLNLFFEGPICGGLVHGEFVGLCMGLPAFADCCLGVRICGGEGGGGAIMDLNGNLFKKDLCQNDDFQIPLRI